MGLLLKKEREIESAISYFGIALAITIDTFGENHQSVAKIQNQLGTLWDAKGDYDKAIYFFNLSLAYNEENLDKDHPIVITCKNNLKFASEKKLIKMNAMAVPHQIHAKGSERNKPCICGSGKKYKKCCGLL